MRRRRGASLPAFINRERLLSPVYIIAGKGNPPTPCELKLLK
jgi:hypothetical protein